MNNDPRGTMIQQGNTMRINNGFVEDVSCFNNARGQILVSYAVRERNNITSIQDIQLNINRGTVILNSFGQRMCLCCIQAGSWVNATFSARMTRSIPPQANAFLVTVLRSPRPSSSVTIGRIIMIDFDNNFLITEDPDNSDSQMKFIITNSTSFTSRFGAPIRFSSLWPGQMVRITHANFQTPSIPPQTTAFNVQLI